MPNNLLQPIGGENAATAEGSVRLAYNLVWLVLVRAARTHGVDVNRFSFAVGVGGLPGMMRLMTDYEGSRREFLKLLAECGEEPAFITRARTAEMALEALLQNCKAKRQELLKWPRLRLANLKSRIDGNWPRIARFLARAESAAELAHLHETLRPDESMFSTSWTATDQGCLRQFLTSAQRHNRRWRTYLLGLDLDLVNKARRDYNDYYPLEKACAFGNEFVSDDFQPLVMIDTEFLERLFPYLPCPQMA